MLRMALVIGAGALLLTAITVAVAPRMWRIANAHEETPVELPDFAELAHALVRVRRGRATRSACSRSRTASRSQLVEVPRHVIEAFLAVEDSEFCVHHGVNVRSLFRATLSNFATEGPVQGASTITMQVVKNDYMAGFERDGRYKLLQMTYAVRLEKHKTKDEILERYLNTVFFGAELVRRSAPPPRRTSARRCRRPHVRRGGVPRRAGASAVDATTRSCIPSRAATGSSRCSTGC